MDGRPEWTSPELVLLSAMEPAAGLCMSGSSGTGHCEMGSTASGKCTAGGIAHGGSV